MSTQSERSKQRAGKGSSVASPTSAMAPGCFFRADNTDLGSMSRDMGWSPRLTERPPLALPTSKTCPEDGGRTVFNFSTTTERPAAFWTSS